MAITSSACDRREKQNLKIEVYIHVVIEIMVFVLSGFTFIKHDYYILCCVLYIVYLKYDIRGLFFNLCYLLNYFSCGRSSRMLFICGESLIFSSQIGIKLIAF